MKRNLIWIGKKQEEVERLVAMTYDGADFCVRSGDYAGVAKHAMSLATESDFFDKAPIGLACPNGFYRIDTSDLIIEPLSPAHRQRVQLNFSPREEPTPKFDAFLHETFQSSVPDEEAQQIGLVQDIAGAIMLGIAPRYQKAFLLYDPIGRAGKGTLMSILQHLVPKEFVSAVNPFDWNREYYLMNLVGKRLNIVGELPEDKAFPAAEFKSVLGGDLLMGRHPTKRPVSFRNSAGHVFMSNHLITSKDNSEAYFARWVVVEFPNSRILRGLPLDPHLADRIIKDELPGIAHWALQGGMRVLAQDRFSPSMAHERLLAKWRRGNNSLEEFIHEDCKLGHGLSVRRAHLYSAYQNWCRENGRKAFAKKSVKDMLEVNLTLSVTHATLDGYEIFRGIDLKAGTYVPTPNRDHGFTYGAEV